MIGLACEIGIANPTFCASPGSAIAVLMPMTITFRGGETLDLPGEPRIVHLPGHTPGSSAIHVPAVDAVFVGDAMTTRSVLTGEMGPHLAPFTLDPAQAAGSLGALEGVDATWVLPGHGDAWSGGAKAAVEEIRRSL